MTLWPWLHHPCGPGFCLLTGDKRGFVTALDPPDVVAAFSSRSVLGAA